MAIENISTGCKSIDALIDNGLPFKSVIHVYGEAGTGKSTLVMQCAKNCVLRGYKVLFLDNEHTCSSTRLKVICETKYSEISQAIFVHEPSSFENQAETIENLEKFLSDKTKMVIIDTMTTQYRRVLTEDSKKNIKLNKDLNYQIAVLKDLANRYDLIVFLTNQVRGSVKVRGNGEGFEPVAGAILNYWSDYEIQLGFLPDRQMSIRTATLIKHPINPTKTISEFQLTESGMQDI